jgi:hypothetical protein
LGDFDIDLPVVRTVLDQLGERLLKPSSQQFALQITNPKHLACTLNADLLM